VEAKPPDTSAPLFPVALAINSSVESTYDADVEGNPLYNVVATHKVCWKPYRTSNGQQTMACG
jgi:hypothetical protein